MYLCVWHLSIATMKIIWFSVFCTITNETIILEVYSFLKGKIEHVATLYVTIRTLQVLIVYGTIRI